MKRKLIAIAGCLLACTVAAPASEINSPGPSGPGTFGSEKFELTPFAGYRWGGSVQTADGQNQGFDGGRAFGLTLDFSLARDAAVRYELLWSHQDSGFSLPGPGGPSHLGLTVDEFQLGGLLEKKYGRFQAFITGLLGASLFSPEGNDSKVRFGFSLGGGVKFFLTRNLALRADVRGYCTVAESDSAFIYHGGTTLVTFSGSTLWQGEVSGGLVLAF